MNTAYLILEDGSVFSGRWFGHEPATPEELKEQSIPNGSLSALKPKVPAGEVIFNTGMAGYHEILTDPSYFGQIIVMTYPHIGNYGTDEEWTEYGSGDTTEKLGRLRASGLVVRSLYQGPIPAGRRSLADFLQDYQTSGITEVDTRRLTLHIRNHGSPNGVIVGLDHTPTEKETRLCLDYLARFPRMEGRNLVSELSLDDIKVANPTGSPHIALIDCGVKAGIVRELTELGCKVSLIPNLTDAEQILELNPDGVLYSNGPGDPGVLEQQIVEIRKLLGKKPLFGICLGHQIISMAMGAARFKMKFGHHGVNNPVRDEKTGVVLITSQNHGFAITEDSLPKNADVWFRNANDRTIEGIIDPALPVLTSQFHPEAAPGPRDSLWIFKRFLEAI